jgi:desulfoferrodoxin-like iron-binding protein|uniref:Desulfoferrodoxin N-terminal domain-containing protein n=1 Tax=candidate division WOR-3 bacterium TaxID=2052148 RepID=A0A7C6A826_UNCW3
MKKKQVKKKVKKTTKPKGPVYLCRTCGAEIVVTKEGAGITNLVCCNQVMEKK